MENLVIRLGDYKRFLVGTRSIATKVIEPGRKRYTQSTAVTLNMMLRKCVTAIF